MNKYTNYLFKTLNTIFYFIRYGGTGIVMNSWTYLRLGKIKHRNFGDELNYYLLRELSGKPVSNLIDICKWGYKGKPNILFIGSLVEDFVTPDTIIWGSGALFGGDRPLRYKPKEVRAVRGKYTRDYLMKNGVCCPEVYGDPALLCPMIYLPKVEKKYKVGFIPHVDDFDHPAVKAMEVQGAHIIHFAGYKRWTDVIDEICQCEIIASSSLHGLILADAYKIPNIWITLKGKLLGGKFKFYDYFSGVGRCCEDALAITVNTELKDIVIVSSKYKMIEYNPCLLIKVAPFDINLPNVSI